LAAKGGGIIYPIHIKNSWDNLAKSLTDARLGKSKVFIVTDVNVANLYLEDVSDALSPYFSSVSHAILPVGEAEKNLSSLSALLTVFHSATLDRSSVITALGGGVISDIAGFAASIYMRGISYISMPTTLLGMVDSSIGGKTGIDFDGAKNLIGSFHNPSLVYMNLTTLKSLDNAQYISGLAEVIKYGIIIDDGLFNYVSDNKAKITACNPIILEKIIRDCVHIKSEVVAADEKEVGLRQILNYGHTFGHAIESLCDFSLPHGHCVALGMMCAANFSYNMGRMSAIDVERIAGLLDFFGLPTKLPKQYNLHDNDNYDMMCKDKKMRNDAMTLIISHKIGSAEIINDAKQDEVIKAINSIL